MAISIQGMCIFQLCKTYLYSENPNGSGSMVGFLIHEIPKLKIKTQKITLIT